MPISSIPPIRSLTEDAHRRLEAIGEATDLGSGFQLAFRDLEIRGAGSILGEVQSGHIAAVGFDLYAELVAEAVSELEGREPVITTQREVRIDLPVDAHLPDSYVADQELRLEAYRRLATTATNAEVDDVAAEWVDRFGPLPSEADALISLARLRVEALRVGLEELVQLRHEVRMGPVDLKSSQEVRLRRLQPRSVLNAQEGVIFIPAPRDLVPGLISFLGEMWELVVGTWNLVLVPQPVHTLELRRSPLSKDSVLKKLALLLVIAVLALTACGSGGSGGGVAATVNGTDITVADVEALIVGDEAEIPKADFAGALGFLVQQQIISDAAETELGITIEESEIATEADTLVEESSTEGQTREEFLEAQQITEELLQQFAHSQLLVGEISETLQADVEAPTQEEIDTAISAAEANYCASHILVATEQEANDVLARIEAGEDFATLAAGTVH